VVSLRPAVKTTDQWVVTKAGSETIRPVGTDSVEAVSVLPVVVTLFRH
jgi:hypothetical protein